MTQDNKVGADYLLEHTVVIQLGWGLAGGTLVVINKYGGEVMHR